MDYGNYLERSGYTEESDKATTSNQAFPISLQTNYVSRNETLKKYKLLTVDKDNYQPRYINFDTDTVLVCPWNFYHFPLPNEHQQIKHLMIRKEYTTFDSLCSGKTLCGPIDWKTMYLLFPMLEELVIWINDIGISKIFRIENAVSQNDCLNILHHDAHKLVQFSRKPESKEANVHSSDTANTPNFSWWDSNPKLHVRVFKEIESEMDSTHRGLRAVTEAKLSKFKKRLAEIKGLDWPLKIRWIDSNE